jgi:hypothetical protein
LGQQQRLVQAVIPYHGGRTDTVDTAQTHIVDPVRHGQGGEHTQALSPLQLAILQP